MNATTGAKAPRAKAPNGARPYTWIIVVIIMLLVGVGGYYAYTTLQTDTDTDGDATDDGDATNAGTGLRVDVTPRAQGGDVVTISDSGVSSSSTTETYLAAPRLDNCANELRGGNPSMYDWCDTDMSSSAEMNYAYDPVGGTLSDSNGRMTTTFNRDTGLCSDGTKSCIFEETYDSDRKLIGITNEEGENLINTFADDLWSGRIEFTDAAKEDFNKNITFENNKLHIKNQICSTGEGGEENCHYELREITPKMNESGADTGKAWFPPGAIVMWILFWYKANDKPRPTIKFDIKSEKTLGQMVLDARTAAQAGSPENTQ